MKTLLIVSLLLAAVAFAQTPAVAPAAPAPSEKLLFDIAKIQRDLLYADRELQQRIEQLQQEFEAKSTALRKQLQERVKEAEKACASKHLDQEALACAPPPAAKSVAPKN